MQAFREPRARDRRQTALQGALYPQLFQRNTQLSDIKRFGHGILGIEAERCGDAQRLAAVGGVPITHEQNL